MRFDKFTQKAQAAVLEAQSLAEQSRAATVEPEHLLATLIHQEGGVVPSVLARVGVDVEGVSRSLDQALAALPRAQGAAVQVSFSRALADILTDAQQIAGNIKRTAGAPRHRLQRMRSRRWRLCAATSA
jgi:ATP-dependent Clp protease ATP-binding subunit ClpB